MRTHAWASAFALLAAAWVGCVGDDPTDGDAPSTDGGSSSSSSGGSSSGGSSGGSSSSSSGGGSSSSSSSGEPEAGVDCLGGAFVDGRCQPVTLTALDSPYGVTAGSASGVPLVAWVRGAPGVAGKVERCRPDSCTASVVPIASITGADAVYPGNGTGVPAVAGRTIVTDGARISWISRTMGEEPYSYARDMIASCTLLGNCEAPAAPGYVPFGPHTVTQLALGGDTLFARSSIGTVAGCAFASCALGTAFDDAETFRRSVAADATYLAYVASVAPNLVVCTRSGAACASGPQQAPTSVAAYGDLSRALLDIAGANLVGATPTTVFACTTATCAVTLHKVAEGQTSVVAVAATVTDVYWASTGNGAGTGNTGVIATCPLAGCPAGIPRTIAAGLADPRSLVVFENVLYWVNFGVTGVPGSLQAVRL